MDSKLRCYSNSGGRRLGRALSYSEKNGRKPLVFARPGRSRRMEHSTTHLLLTVLLLRARIFSLGRPVYRSASVFGRRKCPRLQDARRFHQRQEYRGRYPRGLARRSFNEGIFRHVGKAKDPDSAEGVRSSFDRPLGQRDRRNG
ncbi:hypothetical protein XocBAI15_10930 [Xanthomonas oryzae pv. oryzicola]|nr:hypothetical protein XocBAI15_10930 [Xanthomonas oryzae pv. oryzicola]